jgi:hypothetical protein
MISARGHVEPARPSVAMMAPKALVLTIWLQHRRRWHPIDTCRTSDHNAGAQLTARKKISVKQQLVSYVNGRWPPMRRVRKLLCTSGHLAPAHVGILPPHGWLRASLENRQPGSAFPSQLQAHLKTDMQQCELHSSRHSIA